MYFVIDFLKSINPFLLLKVRDRSLSEELILIVYFILFLYPFL